MLLGVGRAAVAFWYYYHCRRASMAAKALTGIRPCGWMGGWVWLWVHAGFGVVPVHVGQVRRRELDRYGRHLRQHTLLQRPVRRVPPCHQPGLRRASGAAYHRHIHPPPFADSFRPPLTLTTGVRQSDRPGRRHRGPGAGLELGPGPSGHQPGGKGPCEVQLGRRGLLPLHLDGRHPSIEKRQQQQLQEEEKPMHAGGRCCMRRRSDPRTLGCQGEQWLWWPVVVALAFWCCLPNCGASCSRLLINAGAPPGSWLMPSKGARAGILDMNIGPLYTPTALYISPRAVGTRARVGPYVSTDRRKRPASGRKRLA